MPSLSTVITLLGFDRRGRRSGRPSFGLRCLIFLIFRQNVRLFVWSGDFLIFTANLCPKFVLQRAVHFAIRPEYSIRKLSKAPALLQGSLDLPACTFGSILGQATTTLLSGCNNFMIEGRVSTLP